MSLQDMTNEELERARKAVDEAYWQAWIQTASVEELEAMLAAIDQRQAQQRDADRLPPPFEGLEN